MISDAGVFDRVKRLVVLLSCVEEALPICLDGVAHEVDLSLVFLEYHFLHLRFAFELFFVIDSFFGAFLNWCASVIVD